MPSNIQDIRNILNMKNINYWTTNQPQRSGILFSHPSNLQIGTLQLSSSKGTSWIKFLQIPYLFKMCVQLKYLKSMLIEKIWWEVKKQFHFISGNGAESRGIEMVITLLLSAIIVLTFLYWLFSTVRLSIIHVYPLPVLSSFRVSGDITLCKEWQKLTKQDRLGKKLVCS